MDWKLFGVFCLLNIVNVILQTVKSLVTIKCGKTAAACINALAYGLYTVVVVYMVCELPLLLKAGVIALANLIGVYVVKWIEEKKRKDRLWKVEATVPTAESAQLIAESNALGLTYNYVDIQKYFIFNFYCPTQKESKLVHDLLDRANAKYFVSESKEL